MQSVIPPGAKDKTVIIGKSQGYFGLAVNFDILHDPAQNLDVPSLTTAWQPTPNELARLNAGASVIVNIINVVQHPPIMVTIGNVPD